MKPIQETKVYKLHSGLTIKQEIDWQRNVTKYSLIRYEKVMNRATAIDESGVYVSKHSLHCCEKVINTATGTNDLSVEEFLTHCIDFLYWQNSKSPTDSIEGKTFHNPNYR